MAGSNRFWPLAGIVMIAALWLPAGCGRAPAEAAAPDSTPVVSVISVGGGQAGGAVSISGLVGYKRETPLAFAAPGTVSSITADVGDTVRAGQRLASLRRATVGANAAEAALTRETAERQLARVQSLFDAGFASQAALDDARLAVERAADSSALTAPSAGIVLRRDVEPAQTVAAGQPVLILGEPSFGMIVRAAASSADAARLSVGDHANVTVAGGAPRTGVIARMAPKSNDATGAFEIEVRLDNAADLRSGQVAAVAVTTRLRGRGESEIVIPALSLLDARADQGVVYVVDAQNTAHRRTVQTGGLVGDGVVVLSGLAAGERIVGAGAAYVRDNEPVRPAQAPGG